MAADLIAEHGGESVPTRRIGRPTGPTRGGEITYCYADLSHLAANKLLEIERGMGSGSLITLRLGVRPASQSGKTYVVHIVVRRTGKAL